MSAYAKHDTAFFSGRAIFFIAVVLFHVGLLYMFESGLATRVINAIAPPLETAIVQEEKKHDTPPPPPPPKMERPPVEVPPPEVTIDIPVTATSTAITNTTTKHVVAPPPPARVPVRVAAQLDIRHSPSPQEYYPPTSVRMNETGTVVIRLCAAANGSVAGTPTVQKSSGSSRLDEAAVRWGIHVRMRPATLDGKPVEGCQPLAVKFVLEDR